MRQASSEVDLMLRLPAPDGRVARTLTRSGEPGRQPLVPVSPPTQMEDRRRWYLLFLLALARGGGCPTSTAPPCAHR
jgi:hypothetical protein